MNYLIAVEGDELTGKTTVVVPALAKEFKDRGFDVLTSREPGGSEEGEKMRKEIFEKLRQGISPEEQAELFNTARKIHIENVIKPFFKEETTKNKVVILDRYLDSTRVYQGLEGEVPFETITALEASHVGDLVPDLTIIMYFPEDVFESTYRAREPKALKAREKINEIIPFDTADLQKHMQRHKHYLQLPKISEELHENRRFIKVDASQTQDKVAKEAVRMTFNSLGIN